MTLNEFRAWLEGYATSFKRGRPTAEQWAEVQRRLALVEVPAIPFGEPLRGWEPSRIVPLTLRGIPMAPPYGPATSGDTLPSYPGSTCFLDSIPRN